MDCSTNSIITEYCILNRKIDQAETRSKNRGRELISSKQEVIRWYFKFGEAMNVRFEELKKIHPVKSSRDILNREVKKKLICPMKLSP